MKHIISIYANDLKRIGSNWAATVIILGLSILPSLYAWFNIEASWDPYSNTRGIKIAVVNLDHGDVIMDKPVNIGNEVIENLKTNTLIGWTFVGKDEAMRGVSHGDYYAAILIPEDFSARIGSVLSNEPIKAEILYFVNEKINAVAPKITSKGATSIIEEVSDNFVRTANRTIFKIFNELGVQLSNELPTIEKVKNLVFKLENSFPRFSDAVNTAMRDVTTADRIVNEALNNLPTVAQLAKDAQQFSSKLADLLQYSREGIETISPFIKQDLSTLQQAAESVNQVTAILQNVTADPSLASKGLGRLSEKLGAAVKIADSAADWFHRLSQAVTGGQLHGVTDRLRQLSDKLAQQAATVNEIKAAVDRGEEVGADLLDHLHRLSEDAGAIAGDMLNRYDSEIQPAMLQGVDKAAGDIAKVRQVLQDAIKNIPDIETLLKDASKVIAIGTEKIPAIQKNLPAVQAKITEFADKIRAFEEQGDIAEIIDLLKNNFEKESEFFAEPVILKENKLFPIPNYGSAMSPFFTTLSLWVGALLLVSLLTVEVHEEGKHYTNVQIYFGRYFTFLTIALLQSLFVTAGDIYLLKTYVLHPGWFIVFGLIISAVFMLAVYTLVSVFGNVGKALAIVLLVLQLAGSGGTFPIQTTPPFFQAIHPFLPFTYAISMMREAAGGILWDIVRRDIIVLAVVAGLFLLIGLVLKSPINKASAGLVRKAKESKLIH